ncbi:unnamed protein product [Arabis nemorensis]|uniref:Uncharacterized protein n=1 Tax=Arabis nemorensis TaxID=586526 RepID=A0A565CSS8_9BRAS|nr:unnamed protein product [Arabis nemorensis]
MDLPRVWAEQASDFSLGYGQSKLLTSQTIKQLIEWRKESFILVLFVPHFLVQVLLEDYSVSNK